MRYVSTRGQTPPQSFDDVLLAGLASDGGLFLPETWPQLSDAEIAGFVRAVGKVARDAGLVEPGYRLLANTGPDSHQEVPHLHVHIFAGRPLGAMLAG